MEEAPDAPALYTLGHSTRSLDELIALLCDARVRELVDVRSVPRTRAPARPARGIAYPPERALGGFRRPRPGSPNGGWEQPAFQGYADHMASEEFGSALERLQARARERVVCVMCA